MSSKNYYSWYGFDYFIRSNLFVCCWNDHLLVLSSLIDWFLAYLALYEVSFSWIIIPSMFVAVLQEIISLYVCKLMIILYPVLWLILSFRTQICIPSFLIWNNLATMFVGVRRKVASLYVSELIIIIYVVYWFIHSWLT